MANRYVLIDGDIFLYQSLFGAEETVTLEDGELHLSCNMDKAIANFRGAVTTIAEKAKADVIVAISDSENFRKAIYPAYKAQRKSVRKPIGLPALKEAVLEQYTCVVRPTLEADDVLGILATTDKVLKGKKLIVTIDKDLLQVPGAHYDPRDPKQGVFMVTKEEGDRFHMLQTLTGDVVDNFPGCPGIGKVRAERIVDADDPVSDWDKVVAAFEKKGLTEDDALIQARVARILQADDYDFTSKEIIQWTPSNV